MIFIKYMSKSLYLIFILFYCFIYLNTKAQSDTIKSRYESTLDSLTGYLQHPERGLFKKAVFLTENTFLEGRYPSEQFNRQIGIMTSLIKEWLHVNGIKNYVYPDSANLNANMGIYKLLKDTFKIQYPNGKMYETLPFTYDFEDFDGRADWSKMFVLKLLATHSGNCHSLPYLYKILADELGASCWLSLGPNHVYIKNRCKKTGWYNTELTSGDFPIDAWITASGYIPVKAVQSGIYMDTLSNQQAIALCVLDLAKGYEQQTKNYSDGFLLKCCDLVLKYHPVNVQAVLLKAETHKRIYIKEKEANSAGQDTAFKAMSELYSRLYQLGYREMPEKMYLQWLQSLMKERGKFANRTVKETLSDN